MPRGPRSERDWRLMRERSLSLFRPRGVCACGLGRLAGRATICCCGCGRCYSSVSLSWKTWGRRAGRCRRCSWMK